MGSQGEGPIELAAKGLANVKFFPWQSFNTLMPYLYAADVLLIPPSLTPLQQHGNTVLPLKLFLYLAADRPILAPQAPDTKELLKDDVNAALVPAGNVKSAVSALHRLLSDPERSSRLAQAAYDLSQTLTWDKRGERILRFIYERRAAGSDLVKPSNVWSLGRWMGVTSRWFGTTHASRIASGLRRLRNSERNQERSLF